MTVVAFERLRVRYEQGNRAAFWLLLALAVAVLAARHVAPVLLVGRLDDELLNGGDVLAAMPVLFAAAAVLATPDRRSIVTGAVLLAVVAVLQSLGHLSPLLGGDSTLLGWRWLAVAPLLVAGPLLIGYGLGGVHTRLGAGLVAAGLGVAVLAALYALVSSQPLPDEAGSLGSALVAGSVVSRFMYFGWAYVLAAALERRAMWLAVGAGLLILVNLAALALDVFGRAQAPDFAPEVGTVFLLLSLAAWVALIAGILREVEPGARSSGGKPRESRR